MCVVNLSTGCSLTTFSLRKKSNKIRKRTSFLCCVMLNLFIVVYLYKFLFGLKVIQNLSNFFILMWSYKIRNWSTKSTAWFRPKFWRCSDCTGAKNSVPKRKWNAKNTKVVLKRNKKQEKKNKEWAIGRKTESSESFDISSTVIISQW